MSEYSFPLKIVNEHRIDFNDVGLEIIFPSDLSSNRIDIMPKVKDELIIKNNRTILLLFPCYDEQTNNISFMICFIESVYKLEVKEYLVIVDTRNYSKDFFIEFNLINMSKLPNARKILAGFGI